MDLCNGGGSQWLLIELLEEQLQGLALQQLLADHSCRAKGRDQDLTSNPHFALTVTPLLVATLALDRPALRQTLAVTPGALDKSQLTLDDGCGDGVQRVL